MCTNGLRGNLITFIVLSFLNLLLLACIPKRATEKIETITIRANVQAIVDSIAKYNQVTSSAVGHAGIRTVQWDRYEMLCKTATLPELRKLSEDKNAVVRCYAFDALAARNDTATFTILLSRLQDTAQVSTFSGCIVGSSSVGDYLLNSVTPYSSSDMGYKLSVKQKAIVDSVLLFDKRITLSAKYELVDKLKPLSKYYRRVRELAINERMPNAILALARYKNAADKSIIKMAFNNTDTEIYAIEAAIVNPDSIFYKDLTKAFEREWKLKLYDYSKWRSMYLALARYPLQPNTVQLFKRTVQTKDKFRYNTLGVDLIIAIEKYPHAVFEPIKRQVKLDEYHRSEVKDALL